MKTREQYLKKLKTRNKGNFLCVIQHYEQRRQISLGVVEHVKNEKLIKNTVKYKTCTNQFEDASKQVKLVENPL